MPITTLRKPEEETARDNPRSMWTETLKLARAYGLVTPNLNLVNNAAAKILAICTKEF
jgi:hypothetical protein